MTGITKVLKFAEGITTSPPIDVSIGFGKYASASAFVAAKGAPAAEGDVFYNTTTDKVWFYDGTAWRVIENALNNFSAIVDPGVNDDLSLGYQVGSKWLNTATRQLFFAIDVTLGAADWVEVGEPLIGKKEIPSGLVNGVNKNFVISLTPLDDTLLVLRNGSVVPNSQYSFSHPIVTFVTAPSIGSIIEVYYLTNGTPAIAPVSSGIFTQIFHDITAGEIIAKQLLLPTPPPVPTEVVLDVIGGTSQRYGVDFTISGNVLDWNGLRLDGQIVAGSELRIWWFS